MNYTVKESLFKVNNCLFDNLLAIFLVPEKAFKSLASSPSSLNRYGEYV